MSMIVHQESARAGAVSIRVPPRRSRRGTLRGACVAQERVNVSIESLDAVVRSIKLVLCGLHDGERARHPRSGRDQGIAVPAHGPVGVLAVCAQCTAALAVEVAALVA
jgi:hypothetical protein